MKKNNTILIVDDSKENIDALRSALEDEHTIKAALSGEVALKILDNSNIDLVLLDVLMPEMDGFQVMELMRAQEKNKNIPVIFVTGALDTPSKARGLMLGAVDYIAKPYDPDIVSIKVRNSLENKMYRDSLEHLVDIRTQQLLATRDALITGMSLIAESRDGETGGHIKRIREVTSKIAHKYLEMYPDLITPAEVNRIVLVSPLHDVGKVSISDSILLKPGKLTEEEFKTMQNHTVFGADLLRKTVSIIGVSNEEMSTAIEIAESHHEKYDGTGYPHRLKGEEIPISARIVAIADVFDALISLRAYKPAFTREKTYEVMLKGDGRTMPSHFDPKLMEIFDILKDEL